MAIDYGRIMKLKAENIAFSYGESDSILYSLGIGFGRDPMDEKELPFVYGKKMKAAPTMVVALSLAKNKIIGDLGINPLLVVHGEQRLTLHKPVQAQAKLVADERVAGAFDKGKDKGAIILIEQNVREDGSGEKVCTLLTSMFARGDGGFGGPKDGAPEPHVLPSRAPDLSVDSLTRPDQALLYAMSGDRNPIHCDPAVAKRAGFERPILHGLCTYGIACRAMIVSVCGYDPTRIGAFDVRFAAPVVPGETISTDIWVDGKTVSFRATAKERNALVLNNGRCALN